MGRGKVREHPLHGLGLERAVEALVLSERLRVAGPGMAYEDALLNEPDAEAGEGLVPPVAPRRAVVHGHAQRQAEAAEGRNQRDFDRFPVLAPAGRYDNGEARMVVQHGQRVQPRAIGHRNMALEVHLPQVVGAPTSKRMKRLAAAAELPEPGAAAAHNVRHRRGRGRGKTLLLQSLADLAPAPGRMRLAHLQNRRFNRAGAAARTVMRPARKLGKPGLALFLEPPQQLVGKRAPDPVPPAKSAHIRPLQQRFPHKLKPQRHPALLLERHRNPPCVLRMKVFAMSPHKCSRCLRSAFGDSLTWGYEAVTGRRHAFENRWPNALAAKLGPDVRMIAEGLNGRTTVHDDWLVDENRNGSKALPMLLSSHQPLDLVIIMLGSNDMKHPWWSRASDARRGMQRLVEIMQRFQWGADIDTPKILIIAPPPLVRTELSDFDKMFGHAIKESQFFGKEYKNLAELFNLPFFDAGSVIESDPNDGVHL